MSPLPRMLPPANVMTVNVSPSTIALRPMVCISISTAPPASFVGFNRRSLLLLRDAGTGLHDVSLVVGGDEVAMGNPSGDDIFANEDIDTIMVLPEPTHLNLADAVR